MSLPFKPKTKYSSISWASIRLETSIPHPLNNTPQNKFSILGGDESTT